MCACARVCSVLERALEVCCRILMPTLVTVWGILLSYSLYPGPHWMQLLAEFETRPARPLHIPVWSTYGLLLQPGAGGGLVSQSCLCLLSFLSL